MGSDLAFLPNAVCRHAALNIQGNSRTKDYQPVGGLVGLYMTRWGVTLASLSEVPLLPVVEGALAAGLKPYGFTCRCPPPQGRGLGAAIVFPLECSVTNLQHGAHGRFIAGDMMMPGAGAMPITLAAA